MADNVLLIFEETLYKNLKYSLTYQMIFEIANIMSLNWKKKYPHLSESTLKSFAEKACKLIEKDLKGKVIFKFDHKKAHKMCETIFLNKELEMICIHGTHS